MTLESSLKNGISKPVAGFVIPLCATIHLDYNVLKFLSYCVEIVRLYRSHGYANALLEAGRNDEARTARDTARGTQLREGFLPLACAVSSNAVGFKVNVNVVDSQEPEDRVVSVSNQGRKLAKGLRGKS